MDESGEPVPATERRHADIVRNAWAEHEQRCLARLVDSPYGGLMLVGVDPLVEIRGGWWTGDTLDEAHQGGSGSYVLVAAPHAEEDCPFGEDGLTPVPMVTTSLEEFTDGRF